MVSQSYGAVLLSVDGSGATKNVNTTTSLTWNFTWSGDSSFQFDRANFKVSLDNGIVDSSQLIMKLYFGYGGDTGSNTLASIGGEAAVSMVTALQIKNLSGGAFRDVQFLFPQSGTLAAGNYSVQLTSTAAVGSDFNVKIGGLKLFDGSTNTELSPTLYNTDGNTDGTSAAAVIPEPSALLLSALGLLALLRRRRI